MNRFSHHFFSTCIAPSRPCSHRRDCGIARHASRKESQNMRFAVAIALLLGLPAAAAINVYGLGASYDSTQSNVVFRVYSSSATQIEVDLYASPMGSPEVLRF